MRRKSGGRLRTATAREIDKRIRSAGDYLGGLINHERVVAEASDTNAVDEEMEARRKFERDLESFLGAARTARNYLIQQCNLVDQRPWLDAHLSGPLFVFHGALADQDMHDHPITVGKTFDIKHTAVFDIVRLVDGGMPRLIPKPVAPQRLGNMRLTYVEAELEPSVRAVYMAIKELSGRDRGIVELAGDYIEGLRAIIRNAERENIFGT